MSVLQHLRLAIVFLFSCLPLQKLTAAPLQVITWNTAQLCVAEFVDLVPCVSGRLQVLRQVFRNAERYNLFHPNRHFVLLLQEVWTHQAFTTFQSIAAEKGWHLVPNDFRHVKRNGLVTITNGTLQTHRFIPFGADNYGVAKGIRETEIQFGDKQVTAINVHTTFSPPSHINPIQIDHLRAIINHLRSIHKDRFAVLGGDFNVGPDLFYDPETYNPREAIWEKSFLNHLPATWQHVVLAPEQVTWSDHDNPMVHLPAIPIRIMQFRSGGHWGKSDSTLDHIFVTRNLPVRRKSRILAEPFTIPGCPTKNNQGRAYLSDHFGIRVVLDL